MSLADLLLTLRWRLADLAATARARLAALRPEHHAILGLLALAVAGQGARLALIPPAAPPGAFAIAGAAADPLAQRDSTRRPARLRPGERVDADKASAAELARVPGIGAGLAKRMVEERTRNGPFGGLAGVDRVRGVGPGLLSRIAPYLAFSGVSQKNVWSDGSLTSGPGPTDFGPPPVLPSLTAGPTVVRGNEDRPLPSSGGSGGRPDLNTADSAGLVQLPGIGPAKAVTVLRWRAAHGPFRTVDDLARIPGIGPKTAAKLWSLAGPR